MLTDKTVTHIKKAANFVVHASVSAVVVTVLESNMEVDESSRRKKAQATVGVYVLSQVVAKQTKQYVDDAVDNAVATWNNFTEARKELKNAK